MYSLPIFPHMRHGKRGIVGGNQKLIINGKRDIIYVRYYKRLLSIISSDEIVAISGVIARLSRAWQSDTIQIIRYYIVFRLGFGLLRRCCSSQ